MLCVFEGRGETDNGENVAEIQEGRKDESMKPCDEEARRLEHTGRKITGVPLWLFQTRSCVYVFIEFAQFHWYFHGILHFISTSLSK